MRKILGLLVLISGMVAGQEMDTVALDTAKKIPTYFGGIYLDVGGKMAPNPPGVNLTQFIGAGIQYNNWSLGFLVYDFKGTTERFLIFPNVFELEYRHGGPVIGLNIFKSKWISNSIQGSFSIGDMTWRSKDDQQDFLRSKFKIVKLATKVEAIRLKFIRPYLNIGYQQMSDLNLADLDDADFSGFFFGVGLRVGYFNQ